MEAHQPGHVRRDEIVRKADELIIQLEDQGLGFEMGTAPVAAPQTLDMRFMLGLLVAVIAGCILGALFVDDGTAQRILAGGAALVAVLTAVLAVLVIARSQGVKTKEIVDVLKQLRGLVDAAVLDPEPEKGGKQ